MSRLFNSSIPFTNLKVQFQLFKCSSFVRLLTIISADKVKFGASSILCVKLTELIEIIPALCNENDTGKLHKVPEQLLLLYVVNSLTEQFAILGDVVLLSSNG